MIYLSVVIPVRNEERFISQTLRSLLEQSYPPDRLELIVVDGRSTDGTRDAVQKVIEEFPERRIRLLDNPGLLSSCARNIGSRAAQGKLVAVIDGHVHIPGDQLLSSMERLKESTDALCLSRPAPLDVPGLTRGTPFWIAVARKSWLGHSRVSYIYSDAEGFVSPVSSGFAYDPVCFDRVGYFDESFDAAEDVEFHHRLEESGIKAYTSPGFLIYSYPRDSFRALFTQQMRYGVGRANFIRKHPSGFSKETLIPPGILISFVVLPLVLMLAVIVPLVAALYFAGVAFYGAVLLVTGFYEAIKRGCLLPGFKVAGAILVTHLGLGWGFLKGIVRR